MKVDKYSANDERRILIGMIVDKTALGTISAHWNGDMFLSKWANIIGKWCVEFYQRYGEAPQESIEQIFMAWSKQNPRNPEVANVEALLGELSGEYSEHNHESNSQLLIDTAGNYFEEVRLRRLAEQVSGLLKTGRVKDAANLTAASTRLELGAGAGIDLLSDKEAIWSTFAQQTKPIIEFPGDLGIFYRNALKRDRFISFIAPEKTGKSYLLLDLAWRAICQRRKVAYFQVGDLSADEIKLRFLVRASRHPEESTDPYGKWPCKVQWPVSIEGPRGSGDIATVRYKKITFKQPLCPAKAWRECRKFIKHRLRSQESYLRLSVHPNFSVNVEDIKSVLEGWAIGGWSPDVVVIDYADVLAPPSGYSDVREQINQTWGQMRSLSQTRHCLVATATQSTRSSYEARTMSRQHVSEEKRKLSHVTGMIGINVYGEEREAELLRLNWLVRRQGKYVVTRCIHVASCLALANPIVLNTF